MSETVNIDAEYMNRWLGQNAQITSLSAKTLFDIQTLIEYYRDIIVPGSKVSISFPTEERKAGPRASVENEEVFIPYHMLQDGRIDETIGAMVHELHHIKLSPSERYINNAAFKFLRTLMDNIDCAGMTLSERIFSDSNIHFDSIFSTDGGAGADIKFLRQVIGDMLFLMNAVEDVRIDRNTPPNLRKYIDKIDNSAAPNLRKLFDEGKLTSDDLSALSFLLLGHHKGIFDSDFVRERYGDTQAIVDADPLQLPVQLFQEFAPEIAKHVLETYYKYCGKPQDPNTQTDLSVDFDFDSYFGGKVQGAVSDGLETEFQSMPTPKAQSEADYAEEESALAGIDDAIEAAAQAAAASVSEDSTQEGDASSAASIIAGADDQVVESSAAQYRAEIEDKQNSVFVAPSLISQVKSFKDVQVHTTTEHFDGTPVVYDAVIYDTVN